MRANGVAERFCTGAAEPFEKFQAWAATVPHTLRNPLYHWTHLELKRYFGITELLDEKSADTHLEEGQRTAGHAGADHAGHPQTVQGRGALHDRRPDGQPGTPPAPWRLRGCPTRVLPAFRPDKALAVHQPGQFNQWVKRLEQAAADMDIHDLAHFLEALQERHDLFPRARLPALRPRPDPVLRGLLLEQDRVGHLRPGAAGRARLRPLEQGAVRRVHDAVLRAAGRGQGLDQAASSGRAAQQQHAPAEPAWPGHGL